MGPAKDSESRIWTLQACEIITNPIRMLSFWPRVTMEHWSKVSRFSARNDVAEKASATTSDCLRSTPCWVQFPTLGLRSMARHQPANPVSGGRWAN